MNSSQRPKRVLRSSSTNEERLTKNTKYLRQYSANNQLHTNIRTSIVDQRQAVFKQNNNTCVSYQNEQIRDDKKISIKEYVKKFENLTMTYNEQTFQRSDHQQKKDNNCKSGFYEKVECESDDDDIFGTNDFENKNDNYILESYNKDGYEIVIVSLEITRQHLPSEVVHKKVEEIQSRLSMNGNDKKCDTSPKPDNDTISQCASLVFNDNNDPKTIVIYDENIYGDLEYNPYVAPYNPSSNITEQMRRNSEEKKVYKNNNYSTIDILNEENENTITRRTKKYNNTENTKNVIEELIDTEENYVLGLKRVIEDYKPYLDRYRPPTLIGKAQNIFSNIEDIYTNSKRFYQIIKDHKDDIYQIAQDFIDHAAEFDLYPVYSKNKPTADLYLKDFEEIIQIRQKKIGDRLGLASYLLTPIQRLGKYVLLLELILKQLNKSNKPTEKIMEAIKIVKIVMRRGNDNIAIDSIKEVELDSSKTGSFLMRAPFNILKPKKFLSMVFLFQNNVIFTITTARNEQFKFMDSIEMSELSLAICEDKPQIFKLTHHSRAKCRHQNATYVLEAESSKIKNEWIHLINNILWSQLTKAKADRLENQKKGSLRNPSPLRKSQSEYSKHTKPTRKIKSYFYD